jgi:hypothetical protein
MPNLDEAPEMCGNCQFWNAGKAQKPHKMGPAIAPCHRFPIRTMAILVPAQPRPDRILTVKSAPPQMGVELQTIACPDTTPEDYVCGEFRHRNDKLNHPGRVNEADEA